MPKELEARGGEGIRDEGRVRRAGRKEMRDKGGEGMGGGEWSGAEQEAEKYPAHTIDWYYSTYNQLFALKNN